MDENTKTANQAWRRKRRKFAPKSRLGCRTCKIRRVKCDLSQPSCLKCQSTGRTCDGYGEMSLAFNSKATEIESSQYYHKDADRAEICDSHHPCPTTSAYHPKQLREKYHGLSLQNLGSFMILPVTGPAQAEAMCFFEYISIKHLNEYHPCKSWRKTLIFFSQTVPSVRYAAIALALVHRNYLDNDSGNRMNQRQSSKDWLSDEAPLLHYNRAIQLLLSQESSHSAESTAVTLLVCYLFTCFDHLAGNYVQAVKHLRGGVELSRNIDQAILHNNSTDDAKPSEVHTIICQVTRQIRRLDMQAATFLVDWAPADIEDTFMSQLSLSSNTIWSLVQAADYLQVLLARVMRLRNTEQMPQIDNMSPSHSSLKDIVLRQLETWSSLFESILQQSSSYETDSETYRLISLLRLQHTIAWILLSSHGPGREIDYDNFLPQFQKCIALAGEIAAAHEQYSGSSTPTFTPEIGIVPLLYIIGVKCRHPIVRREVLSILRWQPIREAVWDSISAARVVERVIEIEEGGSGEGQMIHSMEQIAASQRIEDMSWAQVVSGRSVTRLDITYMFCAREGVHVESLMV